MSANICACPIADLVAGEAVNVRPQDEDVSELVASIRAHGLLQPLVGREIDGGKIEIIDGNRRLKALQVIDAEDEANDVATFEFVHVVLRPDEAEADAFEISLAANVLRKPLHPVREFEAFADLIDKGKDKQAVADHFGIPLRAVEQRLALGRLHEDVRAAWLQGRITGEAARAFTLVSPADQAAYLAQADERWGLRADSVRRNFTVNTMAADRSEAMFVGREAYLAAGGAFVQDLFTENPDFADSALVARLAEDKLAAEAKRIQEEEGWAEVLFGQAAQNRYLWDRITKPVLPDAEKPARAIEIEQRLQAIAERRQEIEDNLDEMDCHEDDERPEATAQLREDDELAREHDLLETELEALTEQACWLRVPAEKRAKAVTVIQIERGGRLAILRGHLKDKKAKPAPKPTAMAAPAPKASADGEEAPEPVRLSAALLDGLALTATRAAAHVLATEPRIALAALVATHAAWGTPIRLTSNGRGEGPELAWPARQNGSKGDFGKVFREAIVLPMDDLQRQAAHFIARTLDFTSKALGENSSDKLLPANVTDLRAALPAEAHRAALVQAFDPADYFSAAPKQEALTAIADCGDEPAKYAKMKKADLGAAATRLATARAWLPPLLRGEVFEAVLPAEPKEGDAEAAAREELYQQAITLVLREKNASTSFVQRHLQIGYNLTAWFMERMETEGIVGPANSAGKREILKAASEAEPETPASAADAALQIWLGEERTRLLAMKAPELRELLKERGVTIPFGSTKMQLIELALQHGDPDSSIEEAA